MGRFFWVFGDDFISLATIFFFSLAARCHEASEMNGEGKRNFLRVLLPLRIRLYRSIGAIEGKKKYSIHSLLHFPSVGGVIFFFYGERVGVC